MNNRILESIGLVTVATFIIIFVVMSLVGLSNTLWPEKATDNNPYVKNRDVKVYRDMQYRVNCWVYKPTGSISCLPLGGDTVEPR